MAARLRGRPAPRQAGALALAPSLRLSQDGPRGLSAAGWSRDGRASRVGLGAWVSVVPALGPGLGGPAARPVCGAFGRVGWWWLPWPPGLPLRLAPAVPGLPCARGLRLLLGSCAGAGEGLVLLGTGLMEAGPVVGPPRIGGSAGPRALGPCFCLRLLSREVAGAWLALEGSGLVEAGPAVGPPRRGGSAGPRASGPCCSRLPEMGNAESAP